jgi:hypothetical protein
MPTRRPGSPGKVGIWRKKVNNGDVTLSVLNCMARDRAGLVDEELSVQERLAPISRPERPEAQRPA